MGTFELNDYENLRMMIHSIERFWNDFEGECDLVKVTLIFECDSVFELKLMVGSTRYHSNFYRTTTIPELGKA